MNFSTGNSGNLLRASVTKTGDGCVQEGSYCQYLGKDVCPEIYGFVDNGYVMEALQPSPRYPRLLRDIEELLKAKVWSRPALPISNDEGWRNALKKFGVEVPSWLPVSIPCLCHGDPTASNALIREHPIETVEHLDGTKHLCMHDQLIMGDPRPPRDFIPQCRETDMGRILQSHYGWEEIAYGEQHVDFLTPDFTYSDEVMGMAMFWCGAAVARIEYLERSRANRRKILDWCLEVRGICNV